VIRPNKREGTQITRLGAKKERKYASTNVRKKETLDTIEKQNAMI